MVINYPALALMISALALVISAASLFFGRKDKSTAVVESLKKELSDSQRNSLNRIESTLQAKVASLEALGTERHTTNSNALTEIREKVARVDEMIKQIPNHRDIDALQTSITSLTSQVSKLEGALEANTRMTERINEFLMHRGSA